MSSNIPPKFYNICRLCLAPISDSEISKLSIFNNNANKSKGSSIIPVGSNDSGGQETLIPVDLFNATAAVDDESDYSEFTSRIATCLNLKVR